MNGIARHLVLELVEGIQPYKEVVVKVIQVCPFQAIQITQRHARHFCPVLVVIIEVFLVLVAYEKGSCKYPVNAKPTQLHGIHI